MDEKKATVTVKLTKLRKIGEKKSGKMEQKGRNEGKMNKNKIMALKWEQKVIWREKNKKLKGKKWDKKSCFSFIPIILGCRVSILFLCAFKSLAIMQKYIFYSPHVSGVFYAFDI